MKLNILVILVTILNILVTLLYDLVFLEKKPHFQICLFVCLC